MKLQFLKKDELNELIALSNRLTLGYNSDKAEAKPALISASKFKLEMICDKNAEQKGLFAWLMSLKSESLIEIVALYYFGQNLLSFGEPASWELCLEDARRQFRRQGREPAITYLIERNDLSLAIYLAQAQMNNASVCLFDTYRA